MFFKGYVETKDKQCVEKFKNRTDFKNFEQVQSLPEFAGILAEDAVLIDIDDGETSDILFNIVKDYHLSAWVYAPPVASTLSSKMTHRTAALPAAKPIVNWQSV